MSLNRFQCSAMAGAAFCASLAAAETLHFRSDLAGAWIDISGAGTALNLAADDVAGIDSPVGNAVFPAGQCWVGNNGAVGFGANNTLPPVTQPIPSTQLFGGSQSAVPFATDIGDDQGNVFWDVVPRPGPSRGSVLVVQWHDHRFVGSNDTGRFQLQIFSDPGPDHIYAQFLYNDIQQPFPDGGEIATIGYQNGSAGFNDVQWSYHVAGAVANGTVLSLVPEPTAGLLLGLLGVLLRRR